MLISTSLSVDRRNFVPNSQLLAVNSGAIMTRRSLLQRTGWVIAAVALPPGVEIAAQSASPAVDKQPISQIMAKLSAYMSEARSHALPDEVVEKAKHHILDTLAAMVSGSQLPGGRAAIRFASAYGGEKVATVVAS